MKTTSTIIICLAFSSAAAIAQTAAPVAAPNGPKVITKPAPTVVVAGGVSADGVALALIPLALLAALGGGSSGSSTTTTVGGN